MTVRSYPLLAAAVGLWLANPLPRHAAAQQPGEPGHLGVQPQAACARPGSANQRLADAIAADLRQAAQIHHYRLDVSVENGVAEVSGQVADQAQRDEVLRIVHGVAGVLGVRDGMVVGTAAALMRTNATVTNPNAPAAPLQEPGQLLGRGVGPGPVPGAAGPVAEPTPIFQAPPGLSYAAVNPPPLPPYAWPTFAPYNNYSRVAYPTLYPYQAWPFIGPQYPFPKVPLGWRSVRLTYYNGKWWYGKTASGHDWWRIRYW